MRHFTVQSFQHLVGISCVIFTAQIGILWVMFNVQSFPHVVGISCGIFTAQRGILWAMFNGSHSRML